MAEVEERGAGKIRVVAWFALYAVTAIGTAVAFWWLLARGATATGWMRAGSLSFIIVYVVLLVTLPLGLFVGYVTLVAPSIRRRKLASLADRVESDRAGVLKELVEMARADLEIDYLHGVYELLPYVLRACDGRAAEELAELRRALDKLNARLGYEGRPRDGAMSELDGAVREALEAVAIGGMEEA